MAIWNIDLPSKELTYSPPAGTFEDDFPFHKVGHVSFLQDTASNTAAFILVSKLDNIYSPSIWESTKMTMFTSVAVSWTAQVRSLGPWYAKDVNTSQQPVGT